MKRKIKLLLVDDNPANLVALQAVLSGPEYELVEASSGEEALEQCKKSEFALIVLDVQMPGMDGYATAREIKTTPLNHSTPIMFVTAIHTENPHMRKGFEVGAVDYLGKPFDPDIFRAKVGMYSDLYLKTKRLEETEALLESHAQIKTLLEALPVGVLVANAEGQIYETNQEANRIWGAAPKIGLDRYGEYKGFWPHTKNRISSSEWALARALKDGTVSENEQIEIEAFDGTRRTILNSAFPLRGQDGQILGAVVVIQDISEREKLASEIEQKASALADDIRQGASFH